VCPRRRIGTTGRISMALTCTFNRWGTLLAVGCNDGRIVIWDFLTRGIAKIISAHIHPVCSLSWSRDGHKLVSASTDNIVSQWDVLTGDCDHAFRFPSPILKLQYHPRDMDKVLVCPMKSAPVLLLRCPDSKHVVLRLDDDSDLNVVAAFDRRGDYIYTGNAKGKILVLNTNKQDLVASVQRMPHCFLINTADRIIRVYDGREILTCGRDGEPEPIQKLQDLVNTVASDCVRSSASSPASIWAQNQVENWSAFAPDFKELDENVEYEESEFDIEDEDKSEPEQTGADAAEDEEVDVTSVDPTHVFFFIFSVFCSDEELEDFKALLYLPIAPEVEDPEENPFGPPPDAAGQNATPDDAAHSGPGDKKQRQPSYDGGPPKKKIRTTTIELQGVPNDEVHPLLGVKGDSKSKKKAAGRPKGSKGKDKDSRRPKVFRDRAEGLGTPGNLVSAVYKQHEVQGLD
ncbi:LOW QUALITY PROTEIN: retinoblastoma-binding protein 5, partial [Cyprinus carpio]|uniref:LOW QUALITY PROTEIN: retinoblastoma-binding protein 5 n=1 Tax=Cyprinus carpio TaxID=7962 RepID=A0A9R0ANV3_CYPCA